MKFVLGVVCSVNGEERAKIHFMHSKKLQEQLIIDNNKYQRMTTRVRNCGRLSVCPTIFPCPSPLLPPQLLHQKKVLHLFQNPKRPDKRVTIDVSIVIPLEKTQIISNRTICPT